MSAALALTTEASLPALIDRASNALAGARSSAEVLEARDLAAFAYDAAKRSARLASAKGAHDTLIAAAHRAQAHALEIEAGAKRRLADEYDAAQDRGEVQGHGGKRSKVGDLNLAPTATELGLRKDQLHEARVIRDAEKADPGIVRRVLDEKLERREEPTKAALRQAVVEAAERGLRPERGRPAANPIHQPNPQYDAMLAVSAGCRDMMEKVRDLAPEYIVGGFVDQGQRERNIAHIRECRDYLTSILETADA
jgi:hypothetical protein